MVWVPGGDTRIGSDRFEPEEAPARLVRVDGFWMSRHEVTNSQFGAFVKATGYVTRAERVPATAAVFDPASGSESAWALRSSATWRSPQGSARSDVRRGEFPVVQVTLEDARAFARWAKADLPTEAEWERAARGGLADADYVWGNEAHPSSKHLANHHQGAFPAHDSGADGYAGLAPAGCFPPNRYGFFDMAGNVWEWTADRWSERGEELPGVNVVKGGSFLCSDDYCMRYRPSARQPADVTLSTQHTGFRIIRRARDRADARRTTETID